MVRTWILRRSAAVWLGVACTIIVWAGLANYWGTQRLIRTFDSAAQSQRALEKLQSILARMGAAESSVKEYVITGNASRLSVFQEASRGIPIELKQLQTLLAANRTQEKTLQKLERMTLGHLSYLRQVVRVRRTSGLNAAVSWIVTEESGSPRGLTQQLLGELQRSQGMEVQRRLASAAGQSANANALLVLAALLSLGFLLWAYTLWRRESRDRAEAEQERGRLHRFLYSIIDRIPYSILVKEAKTLRVVHANTAADRWSKQAALASSTESETQDRQALAAAQPVDIPEDPVVVAGEPRLFHTQKVAVPDAAGQPAYLVTISEDITEQKQAQRLVELSRDAAVESARIKAEFLRNMTHEFRTPLSVIIGMTTLLEGTKLLPEQRRFAGSVRKAAEGLSQLAKTILDFSKIETGRFQIEEEDVPLLETVDSVLLMFSEQARAKGLELSSASAGNVPPVLRGDRARFRQVLTQLISNSVKFTAKGAVVVRLTLAKEDEQHCWIGCRVIDTGPGMDAAMQAHLFDAFRQGDGSATRRFGGTGIGLAIAKRIVDLMGGEMGVECPPPEGTTVWMTLPFRKQSTTARPEPAFLQMLIVEESETTREQFREQASLWGLASQGVASGEAALTLLRQGQAAGRPMPVILVGLHLLDMDGAAFAHSLRNDLALKDATLVALSDRAMDHATLTALGFTGCLSKELAPAALYEALKPFLTATKSTHPHPSRKK